MKSAWGIKVKCFRWIPHIKRKHFSLTLNALLLDPWRTSTWPPTHLSLTPYALFLDTWRTSPWPKGLIFQSWKKQRKMVNKKSKIILGNPFNNVNIWISIKNSVHECYTVCISLKVYHYRIDLHKLSKIGLCVTCQLQIF